MDRLSEGFRISSIRSLIPHWCVWTGGGKLGSSGRLMFGLRLGELVESCWPLVSATVWIHRVVKVASLMIYLQHDDDDLSMPTWIVLAVRGIVALIGRGKR